MRRFRLQILIRVLGIGALMALAVYLAVAAGSYLAAALVGGGVAVQLYGLVRYLDKTNRDLTRLLHSVRYSDFSQAFTDEGRGGAYADLSRALMRVMDDFRAARAEKEEQHRYLQTVIQHIGVGLLSFRRDGTVELINAAAKRLLRVSRLKNVHALASVSPKLVETLFGLGAGERVLVQVVDDEELLQLSIHATAFRMRGDSYTLVSIQDIQSELEEKETEAWQKLTRVLTHEIMNSITPISSLASTANDLLAELHADGGGSVSVDGETIGDVQGAVRTIEKRSQGLLHFVSAYRSVTRIPRPEFRIFRVSALFADVVELLGPQLHERHVRLRCTIEPPTLDLTADPELITQVLINLVKNAIEATAATPGADVRLSAHIDERGRPCIQVVDNGPGIVEEAMDKVFVPFFTTKPEGSGIGLSLSRQIMRQHGGSISVFSEPNERTVFTLRF